MTIQPLSSTFWLAVTLIGAAAMWFGAPYAWVRFATGFAAVLTAILLLVSR